MARVFISFVHEDDFIASQLASVLARELELRNEVFLFSDQGQVVAGNIWLDQLKEALENCEVLVLLLSGRSLKRAWVHFEAGAVWLSGRPVIPVCIGNLKKNDLPQPYAGMQAVQLPWELDYLFKSVHHHLRLTTPKPLSRLDRDLKLAHASDETNPTCLLAKISDPYGTIDKAFAIWKDERRKLPTKARGAFASWCRGKLSDSARIHSQLLCS